jgi:hypothetical protein
MTPLSLQLLFHGAIVLLIGLLSGIPYGSAITRKQDESVIRGWRVAHAGLAQGGTLLIAIAAVLSYLTLPPVLTLILVWAAAISGYGFCIALPYGAYVGQRGLSAAGPTQNRVVYAGNMVGAIGSLISTIILIVGCLMALL